MMNNLSARLYADRQVEEREQRLMSIRKNWNLYDGDHTKPLKVKPGQVDDNVIVNLARPIVDRGISFLFGKDLHFQVDETAAADSGVEQFLTRVWKRNKKMILLQELAQNGALGGHAFVKLDPQADGHIKLINLDPACIDLAWSTEDINDVHRFRIEFVAADEQGHELMRRQDIQREADGASWMIRDFTSRPGQRWVLVKETAWPFAWAPIVHTKNLPRANSAWGDSDLEDAQLNDSLNLIASTTRKIIRLHGHPRTYGKGFQASELKTWGPDEMIVLPNKDSSVENLEMQSDLAAARQFYLDLRAAMYSAARMPDLSTFDGKLGTLTNFGLRVLFHDMLAKNDTKRMLYGGLVEEINQRLAELGGFGPDVMTTITWPDPLPVNTLEQTSEVAAKQKTGLISDETLTMEMSYDYAGEQKRIAQQAGALGAKPAPATPQPAE